MPSKMAFPQDDTLSYKNEAVLEEMPSTLLMTTQASDDNDIVRRRHRPAGVITSCLGYHFLWSSRNLGRLQTPPICLTYCTLSALPKPQHCVSKRRSVPQLLHVASKHIARSCRGGFLSHLQKSFFPGHGSLTLDPVCIPFLYRPTR